MNLEDKIFIDCSIILFDSNITYLVKPTMKYCWLFRNVAQLGRADGCRPSCRWFESGHSDLEDLSDSFHEIISLIKGVCHGAFTPFIALNAIIYT